MAGYESGRETDQGLRPFVIEGARLFVPMKVYSAMQAAATPADLVFNGRGFGMRPSPRLLTLAGMRADEICAFLKANADQPGDGAMDLIPDRELVD